MFDDSFPFLHLAAELFPVLVKFVSYRPGADQACRRVVVKAADLFVVAGNQHRDVVDPWDTSNQGDIIDTDYAKGSRVVRATFVPCMVQLVMG